MRLAQLKRTYDAVFSLGDRCFTSGKLIDYGLRPYSGVLDWVKTDTLANVSMLLRNRFASYMELQHMRVIDYHDNGTKLLVKDTMYNMISGHDFKVAENPHHQLVTYPAFREKINRRIHRFYTMLEHAQCLLFVRTKGSYEEALELQSVLSSFVKHQFHVLLINDTHHYVVFENDWNIPNVCAIQTPLYTEGNKELWDCIFTGIQYIGSLHGDKEV
ncbi:DUF1796 family putative cysteine peptidase [Paenibacillus sp. 481]|uniref:DUF1796 family putative cysteine peptidase n=1 Tax=Paenibacillus sp. 481 TaxID=2835869 RepID=UPI001E4FFADB|nr:DUF1796 family putative cysteine peptidase [Paenibacillus sp. 481]UHA74948.1 peptidase [Paenibacillus sp. 481]